MKTYLITGGSGFIGSNFIQYMFGKHPGIRVINMDSLTYAGNPHNLKALERNPGYSFIKADICDKNAVDSVFSANDIDCVVHFAAESHVDRSIKNPEVFVRTNVLGTAALLNAAKASWADGGTGFRPGKKFVHISTDEVYGALGAQGFFTEATPLDPHSPYSASKAGADMLVKSYYDTYRFPVNITRCSNNYGPYQFPEKLIPLMINNALSGKPLPVYGDGMQVRDWLFVTDHARAIDLVCENAAAGEVYNIGGHNEKYNIDIVRTIITTLRELLPDSDTRKRGISENLIKHVEDRKGHDRRYAIDPSKISRELGWRPETPFSEGIRKTIAWYLDNADWVENVIRGEYLKYYAEMYE